MAAEPYSSEQILMLQDLLCNAIEDSADIRRLLTEAGLSVGQANTRPGESHVNHWHRGLSEARKYGCLTKLVDRLDLDLTGRTDVDELRRLVAEMRRPTISEALVEAAKGLWQQLEMLTEQEDPTAAVDFVPELRRHVRGIQHHLDRTNFWPDGTPGMGKGEAQRLRKLLVRRCLQALAACDVVVSLGQFVVETNDVFVDERDRYRFEHTRIVTAAETKVRLIIALRDLHEDLTNKLL